MEPSSARSKMVVGVHLGRGDGGPAVALLEERLGSSPRFTLRHLSRLPSRNSYGAFASGAAEIVRERQSKGLDWRLVLGSANDRRTTFELLPEDLWPLVRTVENGRAPRGSTRSGQDVSGWILAGTLRSHFESGQLRLAASLLRVREQVDGLLESLLGTGLLLSAGEAATEDAPIDDLVMAVGLALWWAGQRAGTTTGLRAAALAPRVLSSGDLL